MNPGGVTHLSSPAKSVVMAGPSPIFFVHLGYEWARPITPFPVISHSDPSPSSLIPSPAVAGSPAMASRVRSVRPCLESTDLERPPPALTSDVLVEIFLRVASPADLARASAASVAFRRLIADPSFLRRYRSTHPPLLLGFVSSSGFHPAEAPHLSAAVARAVASAADFSFRYVPCHTEMPRWQWQPCDFRDGHVLLGYRVIDEVDGEDRFYRDLAVCDPLSRRYLLLPLMTDDLLASVELQNQNLFESGASFIPSGGMDEETSFSVISWVYSETKLVVFFFSSDSGNWTVGASTTWADLGLFEVDYSLRSCQSVYGCFYWKVHCTNKLLKLDMSTMEFSTYELPFDHDVIDRRIIIVEAGEGKIAMFSQLGAGTSVDYYDLLQNGAENSYEWHMKCTIPLPAQYTSTCYMMGPAEGYIFLAGIQREQGAAHTTFFSLEIKSFKIERISRSLRFDLGCPYFGFPPSMSLRRTQGYEVLQD